MIDAVPDVTERDEAQEQHGKERAVQEDAFHLVGRVARQALIGGNHPARVLVLEVPEPAGHQSGGPEGE